MKIKDTKYPSRLLCYKDLDIQFRNYIADVPDSVGAALLQTGEYELVASSGKNTSGLLEFKRERWNNDRQLIFDTAIGYNNGYGKSGMMIAEGLGRVCDTYVMSNLWVGSSPKYISPYLQSLIDKKLETIETYYVQYWPAFNFKPIAQRQIGYTMLECTRWPVSWKENIMRSCERLIVPCEAQRQAAWDSGIDLDIEVIPLGLDTDMFPYIERPEDPELFLFGIEGTLTYRKGVDLTIKAFQQAFPKDKYKDVGLYIKTTARAGVYYMDLMKDDERIVFNAEWYSPDELIDEFYKKIDCYVFLSRGEGWGMTTVQAMSTGLPVIGSDCSGVQDHLNNKVGYLVPTTLGPVPNKFSDGSDNPFGYPPSLQAENQMWWEPDLDIAAETMLHVYNNRKEAKAKGKKASKYVKETFNNVLMAQKIVDYLDKKI